MVLGFCMGINVMLINEKSFNHLKSNTRIIIIIIKETYWPWIFVVVVAAAVSFNLETISLLVTPTVIFSKIGACYCL